MLSSKNHIVKFNLLDIMLVVTLFVTVLTQIIILERFLKPIMYVLWVGLFFCCILTNKKFMMTKWNVFFVVGYISFFVLKLVLGLFNENHFSSFYLKVLIPPLLVYIIGNLMRENLAILKIQSLMKLYVWASCILLIYVYLNYIKSIDEWLNSQSYLYSRKNSIAQILAIAALVCVIFIQKKNLWQKIVYMLMPIMMIFFIGLIQCRSALFGVILIGAIYIICFSKKRMQNILLISLIVLFLFQFDFIKEYIYKAFVFDRLIDGDLNQYSGNRFYFYEKAYQTFIENFIFGVGEYYLDNSFLAILAENGIIGFIIIESIWMSRIFLNIKYLSNSAIDKRLKIFIILSTIYYLFISFFEGFPPFGPGVVSFLYWFMMGVVDAQSKKAKELLYKSKLLKGDVSI